MTPYTTYIPEFLSDVYNMKGVTIHYSLDGRGRILTELWESENGDAIGEIRNTWSGDRLDSVLWESPGQERLVEFEYDGKGNRIVERNLRNGVLERSVTSRNGLDTEEIYMNGILILKAVWEDGLKISEERITPPRGGR